MSDQLRKKGRISRRRLLPLLITYHLSLLAFYSCQPSFYRIEGFARSLNEGDTICLAQESAPDQPFSQTTVSNGKFYLTGETDSVILCRAYLKRQPSCQVSFFIEPGTMTVELFLPPTLSRVSGTKINNQWQLLADSIQLMGQDVLNTLERPATDSAEQQTVVHRVDSLHRRMSDCILNTARRNSQNALGKYILTHYKEPEFK